MRHLAIILAAAVAAVPGAPTGGLTFGAAAAQTAEGQVWVQLAARKSRSEAEALARAFSDGLAGVTVFATVSGWHAVALGPMGRTEAEGMRDALIRAGMIPSDAYLVGADRYLQGARGAEAVTRPEGATGGAGTAGEASPDLGQRRVAPPRPRPGGPTIRPAAALPQADPHRWGQGLIVDNSGGILTHASVVLGCRQIETAAGVPLRLVVGDGVAGLAYLRRLDASEPAMPDWVAKGQTLTAREGSAPASGLAPAMSFAAGIETGILAATDPQPNATYSALVLAYPGRAAPRLRVPAAVEAGQPMTQSNAPLALRLAATQADAGAPILDGADRVIGIIAPTDRDMHQTTGQTLGIIGAGTLRLWLRQVAGVRPATAIEAARADRPAADAAALTVLCTSDSD